MAKQTFTTGQVLTSAQMTALQLNDYNQTVSAKVATYVLVAADAGTRVTMSNAGATTITVNTSLFTAGDTLEITNIGAGACTITAGTATVSTASSLVLAQYDSGRLYFTSTGVAIWEKYAGAVAAPASPALVLISTVSLSGATNNINNVFSSTYKNYKIMITTSLTYSAGNDLNVRFRTSGTDNSTANYELQYLDADGAISGGQAYSATATRIGSAGTATGNIQSFECTVFNPFETQKTRLFATGSRGAYAAAFGMVISGFDLTTSFDGFSLYIVGGSTFTGTASIYGITQ